MSETYNNQETYTEPALWEKIKKFGATAGVNVVYAVLLLFYSLMNPKVPVKAKSIVVGALGYFIFPLDIISDLLPVVGYTDDIGVLLAAIAAIAFYINEDTKNQARTKLKEWFPNYNPEDLDNVDEKINEAKKKESHTEFED